jgi:RimJ/RimL family protein N-acetyltransferase
MTLTTGRLLLEPLSLTDSAFIIELVNTKGWLQFIGERNVHSESEAVAYIERINNNPTVTYWVAKLKQGGTAIGVITLIQRDYLPHPDIGFAFLPAYAGNGFAYEAASAVLLKIIGDAGHASIFAISMPENVSSIKLLNKLGLQFDKEVTVEKEKLFVYAASADKLKIAQLINVFFSVFTNKNKQQPALDELKRICIPEVMITSKKGTDVTVYNLASFIEPRKKILFDGTLQEFEEQETAETTTIVNNIAQRSSAYKKSGILQGNAFQQTGHKLFQLIKTGPDWKISSVIWEDDTV